MKHLLKRTIAFCLAARAVIRRYRPKIVMVTGSVGKTTTKDAVAAVLSARYYVRKSEKSFNSEFGVPLTVFGVSNPWRNPLAWFGVLKSILALLLLPNHYPTMLVLEVGADRPGDLARILRIATPHAVVVTRLPEIPVHVEAYTSPEAVREEEFSPAHALPAGAPLIIAADDPYAYELSARTPARVITYGLTSAASVCLCDADFYLSDGTVRGMKASVRNGSESRELAVEGSVGRTQLLPVAAAVATATAYDVPLADAFEELKKYEPPASRGRLLRGLGGSLLIDDSYNSSPAAAEEALATLKAFPDAKRRIAVLGDMLELGRYSVMEHERIGALAREAADIVIAVGVRARAFAAAPGKADVLPFDTAKSAGEELARAVGEGDVVLIKGSQSMRMERVVEALLADKSDLARMARQEPEWRRRA